MVVTYVSVLCRARSHKYRRLTEEDVYLSGVGEHGVTVLPGCGTASPGDSRATLGGGCDAIQGMRATHPIFI